MKTCMKTLKHNQLNETKKVIQDTTVEFIKET